MTKSKIELINIDLIKPNSDNPRTIDKKSLETLTKSIVEFPEMTEVRFVVLNKEMMILGGNMRYKAFKEAGIKEIPVDYKDINQIPYYPIGDKKNNNLYIKYKELFKEINSNIFFQGRLGTYKYLDMDDTISSAFNFFNKEIKNGI
jgi:UDP-galactopyranose mutase